MKKALRIADASQANTTITKLPRFHFGDKAIPYAYAQTRLNLSGYSRSQLYAVLVPTDDKQLVKVITAPHSANTSNPCVQTYFIRKDEWPENLKESYWYE